MQKKFGDRRAESHGISHRNPGHLALANPTLYSARDSGKANTQVTEPPINTDLDQESSRSLMLQRNSLQPLHHPGSGALSASCTQLSSAQQRALTGPSLHMPTRHPCHLFPSCQHKTDSSPDFVTLDRFSGPNFSSFSSFSSFLMSSGSFSSFFSIFSSFLMMVLCTQKQSYYTRAPESPTGAGHTSTHSKPAGW